MTESNIARPFADEYAVRGRRRMDRKDRMVMRPSDREIASQWDNIIPYNRNLPTPNS